ncbi:MAG: sulfite exporter TauE/SafE family protein [Vicinamibacteria bacterium]
MFLAAMLAGAVNAVAGGGTLISFPVMTALGLPPVAANMTNSVALCPGFIGGIAAQWRDLAGQRRLLSVLVPLAAAGGATGGALLLASGDRVFRAIVPFLILSASALLAVQDRVRAWMLSRTRSSSIGSSNAARAALPVALAAVYGGYFGAGLGVILLAVLGVFIAESFTRLNALKQALAFSANLAAAIYFTTTGQVVWHVALVMAIGALIGGSIGGRFASRVSPQSLRRVVVALGLIIGLVYLVK